MSRSVHTRPLWIRAASRVREPFASRGHRDRRLARAARRELKASGLCATAELAPPERTARLPRIVVHPPSPGRVHAVDRADIESLLAQIGETFFYGLRTIELAPAPVGSSRLALGRLVVPDALLRALAPDSAAACGEAFLALYLPSFHAETLVTLECGADEGKVVLRLMDHI